jgi:hypothetical protein
MANARIRLTQPTLDAVTELGQKCGIEDADTVIRILIRKYGDDLISLLSPANPIRDRLSQPVPGVQHPGPTVQAFDPLPPTPEGNDLLALIASS